MGQLLLLNILMLPMLIIMCYSSRPFGIKSVQKESCEVAITEKKMHENLKELIDPNIEILMSLFLTV